MLALGLPKLGYGIEVLDQCRAVVVVVPRPRPADVADIGSIGWATGEHDLPWSHRCPDVWEAQSCSPTGVAAHASGEASAALRLRHMALAAQVWLKSKILRRFRAATTGRQVVDSCPALGRGGRQRS